MLRSLTVILTLLAGAARSAEICKAPGSPPLSRVDIFDGPPDQLVILAPDRSGDRWGAWDLSYVYDAGRAVTVRCTFADGSARDTVLAARTGRCRYTEGRKSAVSLNCR